MKAFLSYSHQDADFANKIHLILSAIGIKCYFSESDSHPGISVVNKVTSKLEESDYLIVLYTKNAIESQWVNQEIGRFNDGEGDVLPLVERGVDTSRFGMLQGREYVTFDREKLDDLYVRIAQYFTEQRREKLKEWIKLIVGAVIVWNILKYWKRSTTNSSANETDKKLI